MAKDIRIEYPSAGATYSRDEYGVYEYSFYPERSVLAGQSRRQFLGSFETLREAQVEFPDAVVTEGCGYVAPSLGHLPDEGDEEMVTILTPSLRADIELNSNPMGLPVEVEVAGAIGYPKEESPAEHIRNAMQLLNTTGVRMRAVAEDAVTVFDTHDVTAIRARLQAALDGLKDAPNYADPR